MVVQDLKIRNKKAKDRISALLTLTERSLDDMKESIRVFENSANNWIKKLKTRTVSEDTWKSLQKFANENLRIPIEIDDIVKELINIAEIYFKSKKGKE